MASILVTGGSGYIGQHVCKALEKAGHLAYIADLERPRGPRKREYGFYIGRVDICDRDRLDEVLYAHSIEGIIHLAGGIDAADSNRVPLSYYRNNVVGTHTLLQQMKSAKLKRLVFASSAAVYTPRPNKVRYDEYDMIGKCSSAYGSTKVAAERMIEEYVRATPDMGAISLRLFNVAGASHESEIGETHAPETHLIPLICKAAITGVPVVLNGEDRDAYEDSYTLRDYIHVEDVARAFVQAWEATTKVEYDVFNVCSEHSIDPLRILRVAENVIGKEIPFVFGGHRSDDIGHLGGWSGKIRMHKDFDWFPRNDYTDIIRSAYTWEINRWTQ